MERYKIHLQDSTLPDSHGKKDLVLIAQDESSGSRHGERLSVGKYNVTVVGSNDPSQILHVDSSEGKYVLSLGHPDGILRRLSDDELLEMCFEFESHQFALF